MEKKRENGLWQSSTFFSPRAALRRDAALRFAPCRVALRRVALSRCAAARRGAERTNERTHEGTNERTRHTLWTKGWHTMLERGLGPILPIRVSMPFNFIKAKAREGSCAARLARMWRRNLAPCGAGTCVLQRVWGFLRCTFSEDVALGLHIGCALSGSNVWTRAPNKRESKFPVFCFHCR